MISSLHLFFECGGIVGLSCSGLPNICPTSLCIVFGHFSPGWGTLSHSLGTLTGCLFLFLSALFGILAISSAFSSSLLLFLPSFSASTNSSFIALISAFSAATILANSGSVNRSLKSSGSGLEPPFLIKILSYSYDKNTLHYSYHIPIKLSV